MINFTKSIIIPEMNDKNLNIINECSYQINIASEHHDSNAECLNYTVPGIENILYQVNTIHSNIRIFIMNKGIC